METKRLVLQPDVETILTRSYPPKVDNNAEKNVTEQDGSNLTLQVQGPLDHTKRPCATLQDLLEWLALPPMFTTLRVNTLATTIHYAQEQVEQELFKQCKERKAEPFTVRKHHCLPDCILIHNTGPHYPQKQADMEVIVDVPCGMAILRGADIFKQGVLGAPNAMQAGSCVRVMCDLDGKCLRGFTQTYLGRKLYIGTGIALVSREELFCSDPSTLRGVGVQMTEPLYHAPCLSDVLPNVVFPQNLPSIICGHVLNPQPGQSVIDLCAAPGGKTCHLAALMKNKGRLVAIDKTEDKVSKIKNNAHNLNVTCLETYAFDSRKAVQENAETDSSPPYPHASFDAVLLDGPCSALGQRPSVCNKMSAGSLASFPKLQRMLLTTAVSLVKPGGVLVYSTCTVTLEENEDQVEWLLKTYPEMFLEKQEPHLGGYGSSESSLSSEELQLLQRFDCKQMDMKKTTACDSDTIGFFIAKFRKTKGLV